MAPPHHSRRALLGAGLLAATIAPLLAPGEAHAQAAGPGGGDLIGDVMRSRGTPGGRAAGATRGLHPPPAEAAPAPARPAPHRHHSANRPKTTTTAQRAEPAE